MRTEQTNFLFVYGSLRTGLGNPVRQEIKSDIEVIGTSTIRGKLYDIGRYPGAVQLRPQEPGKIRGEVLLLRHPKKVLRILDQYEGYDPALPANSEYFRDQVTVRLESKKELTAWVYWYNFPVESKRRIRHHDYLDYLKAKHSS